MKRCFYLAMILGLLAGLVPMLLPASPAAAWSTGNPIASWDVRMLDRTVYESSTGQVTDLIVNTDTGTTTREVAAFDITLLPVNPLTSAKFGVASLAYTAVPSQTFITNVMTNNDYKCAVDINPLVNTVHITGVWNGWPTPPPSKAGGLDNVVVAKVLFNSVGPATGTTPAGATWKEAIKVKVNSLTDQTGAAYTGTNSPLMSPFDVYDMWVRIIAAPFVNPISPYANSIAGYYYPDYNMAGASINLAGVSGSTPAPGNVNPTSYTATVQVNDPLAVNMAALSGVGNWNATGDPVKDSVYGWRLTINGALKDPNIPSSAAPGGAPISVAFIVLQLKGAANAPTAINLTWGKESGNVIGDAKGIAPVTAVSNALTCWRGDIDNSGSAAGLSDIVMGQRYLVQLAGPADINCLNFASIKNGDSPTAGDAITGDDVYVLMQYLAGMTDVYFNPI